MILKLLHITNPSAKKSRTMLYPGSYNTLNDEVTDILLLEIVSSN